jgi:type VI secretion system protein ImpK
MSSSPVSALQEMKTNNLAMAFQEVFTVILRTRFFVQRVENSDAFRATLRKMISAAVKDAAAMGYSDEVSKMAIYAMIGFLDESILNSKDPTFTDWARRPLQEEMFGGHFAGEYFFRNVTDLLNRPESAEVADVLELHAICLMLGYKGRFAFGDASEIHTILARIRDKIIRIRGGYALFRPTETPAAPPAAKGDPWVARLVWTTVLLAFITILAYVGYMLLLGQGVPTTASIGTPSPAILTASVDLSQEFIAQMSCHPEFMTKMSCHPERPQGVEGPAFSPPNLVPAGCPRSLAFGDRGVHEPISPLSSPVFDRAASAVESARASAPAEMSL